MPKDQQLIIDASEIDVKAAIGRMITAGITDLGLKKGELTNKLNYTSSQISALSKVLSGERGIDIEQAKVFSKWIKCEDVFLTAQDWLTLETFPEKIPSKFLSTNTFDLINDPGPEPISQGGEISTINSTKQDVSDRNYPPNNNKEETIPDDTPIRADNKADDSSPANFLDAPDIKYDFNTGVLTLKGAQPKYVAELLRELGVAPEVG